MTLTLMILFLADPEPWIAEDTMIYFGAYGGAGIGVLGGILGTVAGVLAPKGKGRALILNSMLALGCLGVVFLLTGVFAVVQGQPYVVYYPFLLLGLVLSTVMFAVRPAVAKRYQEAEQRKLEAAAMRRG